jgi:tetratricopeptide (TPR) repeat protein
VVEKAETDTDRRRTLLEARTLALEALGLSGSDPDRSRQLCDAALAHALPLGLSDALADILRWNGSIHRDSGSLAEAEGCYNHSLAVANASEYAAGKAHALNCLGGLAQLRGDLERAQELYHHAARIATKLDERHLLAMVEQNLGIIAGDQGRYDDAAMHFRHALATLEGAGESAAIMWLLNNLGVLHKREGLPHRAIHDLERALALAIQLGDIRSEGIIEENRSAVYLALGDVGEAERAAEHAYEIAKHRGDALRSAAALHAMAAVRARQGKSAAEIIDMLERAVSLIDSADDVSLLAEILVDLGDRYREAGRAERADEVWERARALADRARMRTILDALVPRLQKPPVVKSRRDRNTPPNSLAAI